MPTLIVVDMQPSFIFRNEIFPGYGRCIDAVKKEILAAIKRNDYIVFVEYCSESRRKGMFNTFTSRFFPTISELTDLVSNYSKKVFVYKSTNDGGEEVAAALTYYGISRTHLRVCGVYTNACVRETVSTLSSSLTSSMIKVIEEAVCAPGGCDWQQSGGIEMMKQLDNVWIY